MRALSIPCLLLSLGLAGCGSSDSSTSGAPQPDAGPKLTVLQIGAATADITPPLAGTNEPPDFAKCDKKYNGKRMFSVEEPYIDAKKSGHFDDGDEYCDSNKNGRYDGIFLAGGSGSRVPTKILDPISARAVVFGTEDGAHHVALLSVDSIGLPYPIVDRIRKKAKDARPALEEVLVSSTHDESAPDSLGLWGPQQTISGVDEFYMSFLVDAAAKAVTDAFDRAAPANLRFVQAPKPVAFQTIWSSYPFVEDGTLMTMQAVPVDGAGSAIFTLTNYGFHAEGNGYSKDPAINTGLSADWPAVYRSAIEARYGGVAIALAGLVGSVETPQVFSGDAVTTTPVMGPPIHTPADDEYSLFDAPMGKTAIPDGTLEQTKAIGQEVANSVIGAFDRAPNQWSVAGDVKAVVKPICLKVENTSFVLAALAGIIARDNKCNGAPNTTPSSVAVLNVGDSQMAFVPGEVFPYTLVRGYLGDADMPFTGQMNTPWVAAAMTRKYTFFAGLGQDMVGYLMPPGDFVGGQGEINDEPWASYEKAHTDLKDKFGLVHNDDLEALGPHAALAMTQGLLDALKEADPMGPPSTSIVVGRFVDIHGAFSRGVYKSMGFSGAVGVGVMPAGVTKFDAATAQIYAIKGIDTVNGNRPAAVAGGFLDMHGQQQNQGYTLGTRGVWLQKADGTLDSQVYVDVYPE